MATGTREYIITRQLKLLSLDSAFGNWLAGFIDGEGCFSIFKRSTSGYFCRFVIQVRDDDLAILEEIHKKTQFGRVYTLNNSYRNRSAFWEVTSKDDCLLLVQLLESHPLRAKKKRDLEIWSTAVREWCSIKAKYRTAEDYKINGVRERNDWTAMANLKSQLHEIKTYQGSTSQIAFAR